MLSLRYSLFFISALMIFACTSVAKRDRQRGLSELASPTGPTKDEALKSYADQTADNTVIIVKPNGKTVTPAETVAKVNPPVAEEIPAQATTPAPVQAPVPAPAPTETQKPVEAPAMNETHSRKPGPVAWSQAEEWLKHGNTRYLTGRLRKDGQSKSDIHRLAAGQKPHSIILSCSDSRVPPELIFDQKLGEIFVIRVAGEMLDSGSVGSIEYAVEHLGTNLVLVMGHTSCGAIKAAHSSLDGTSAGSPDLDKLVKDIQPRIRAYAGKTPTAGYMKESWANVKGVAKDLMARSPILAAAVQSGDLKIAEAMYDTSTGVVTFW